MENASKFTTFYIKSNKKTEMSKKVKKNKEKC